MVISFQWLYLARSATVGFAVEARYAGKSANQYSKRFMSVASELHRYLNLRHFTIRSIRSKVKV